MLMPQTLPSAFNNFLNYHGGKQMHHYHAVRVRTYSCKHFSSSLQGN